MNGYDLLSLLGEIDILYVSEVSREHKNKRRIISRGKWAVLAASILLIIGTIVALPRLMNILETKNGPYASTDESQFTISDGKLISYDGNDSDIAIPESVTTISSTAFAGNTSVKAIIIPATVEIIEDGAFSGTRNLQKVEVADDSGYYCSEDGVLFQLARKRLVSYPASLEAESYIIPDGTEIIATGAFAYSDLMSIVLPDRLLDIDLSAFMECDSLHSITIPANVNHISFLAFDGCDSLNEIIVSDGNANYTSVNGVLYSADKTRLIIYPCGRADDTFTVPDSVKVIELYAFHDCINLKKVYLSDSLTEIQDYAFMNSGLTSVTIPESVTQIGEMAFYGTDIMF